ncbi:MAG: winged helix-turn-helix transcriptional regulator [Clostridiales bacterium]|nr:winged helix-turn-helix transcriptional regulator [Clostridiales bacterium]
MEKIFENFTVSILKLNKLVQKIKLYEMEEYGLKAIHVMCGYYLYEHADGLTISELSKYCLEDKAAISRAVSTMRDKDLAAYDAKTYNGKITLTDKGKDFAIAVGHKADRAVNAGSADMTEEQRVEFYKTLGTIVDNLKDYYDKLTGNKTE